MAVCFAGCFPFASSSGLWWVSFSGPASGGGWFPSASSSVLSAFRSLVPPPAGYFPAMESNQRSPGLRARTRGGGAAVEVRGLQALWLLPAV